MSDTESQLLELLKRRSVKHGQFRLASGGMSPYYIDVRMTEICSEGAFLIGRAFYDRTKDLMFDAIGGLEAGAIPLAAATVLTYKLNNRHLEGFWVRDKTKSHGTKKLIEGNIQGNSRVIVIDDVITKGHSTVKAIDAVRGVGCEVVRVLSLVDRLEGARELFEEHGVTDYQSIFTIHDLGVRADAPRPVEEYARR